MVIGQWSMYLNIQMLVKNITNFSGHNTTVKSSISFIRFRSKTKEQSITSLVTPQGESSGAKFYKQLTK